MDRGLTRLALGITLILLSVRAPTGTSAQSAHPTWRLCREHLDWPTASHVVRTVCTRYPLLHETRRPIGRRLIVNRRVSPHVVERVWWPMFYRARPAPAQPAGRSMTLLVTGYAWGCGASGAMANGQMPYVGAVASNVLPMGAHVTIPSLHYSGVVADRGAPLDIFVSACSQAYALTGYREVIVS